MENQLILPADGQLSEKSVIIYKSEDGTIQLEVQLYNGTVWMNRQQMSTLFGRDIKTIGKHINNARNEELKGYSVVANFATTASDGKTYQVEYYNIDVVLSVGYRVKSQRGIDYRHWANERLKNYLFRDNAVNQRFERLEQRVSKTEEKIDFFVKASLPPVEGIFYDGVSATIYTARLSENLKLDLDKHNSQYSPINIEVLKKFHDRFLIIDNEVYLIGGSIKDLGKKVSTFIKLSIQKEEFMAKLRY